MAIDINSISNKINFKSPVKGYNFIKKNTFLGKTELQNHYFF